MDWLSGQLFRCCLLARVTQDLWYFRMDLTVGDDAFMYEEGALGYQACACLASFMRNYYVRGQHKCPSVQGQSPGTAGWVHWCDM